MITLSQSQLDFGDSQLEEYCEKTNLTTAQALRVLSEHKAYKGFNKWLNAETYVFKKIKDLEENK